MTTTVKLQNWWTWFIVAFGPIYLATTIMRSAEKCPPRAFSLSWGGDDGWEESEAHAAQRQTRISDLFSRGPAITSDEPQDDEEA